MQDLQSLLPNQLPPILPDKNWLKIILIILGGLLLLTGTFFWGRYTAYFNSSDKPQIIETRNVTKNISISNLSPTQGPYPTNKFIFVPFLQEDKTTTFSFIYPKGWHIMENVTGKDEYGYKVYWTRINFAEPLLVGRFDSASDLSIVLYIPQPEKEKIQNLNQFIEDITQVSSVTTQPTPVMSRSTNPKGITIIKWVGPDVLSGELTTSYFFEYKNSLGRSHFVHIFQDLENKVISNQQNPSADIFFQQVLDTMEIIKS